jgi:hypothetical protein
MDNNLIESCKVRYLKEFECSEGTRKCNIQSEINIKIVCTIDVEDEF